MKKSNLLILALFLSGCNDPSISGDTTRYDETPTSETSSSSSETSTSESSTSTIDSSISSSSFSEDYTRLIDIDEINAVVNYGYYGLYDFDYHNEAQYKIKDESIAIMKGCEIYGLKEGETTLVVGLYGEIQKIKIKVSKENNMENYTFNKEEMKGKNIATFGDSVSAFATIGASKTYTDLLALEMGMHFKNYAIGGTTATYMYPGSNIDKEYHTNTTALDGCRVVKNAYDAGELDNLDYAFIAFGHNDQYFQPPVSVEGDDKYCVDNTFATCHSFKGSYRYMINVLRKANPNIKIILLNCTYSEYDKGNRTYGSKYGYADYRKAIEEIAIEKECKLIDPWEYMKQYFDANDKKVYYKDVVHLTIKGQETLYQYIKER